MIIMARYTLVITGSFFCIFSLLTSCFGSSETNNRTVPALFVFGDSVVDVGNNNYLPFSVVKANFRPNGIDFPGRIPTGRFSNGMNAADFLAKEMGLTSSPPFLSPANRWNISSFLTGVNFASGGVGILNGTYHNHILGQSISLSKQVDNYIYHVHGDLVRLLGKHNVQSHLSRSIFAIVIGSNDLLHYFRWSPDLLKQFSVQQYVSLMVTRLEEQLKRLYDNGARKFLIAGAGKIGCIPAERLRNWEAKCNEEANQGSLKYNEALAVMLKELQPQLRGMNYSYFDFYKSTHDLLNQPNVHGFKEIKSGCCGLGRLNAEVPCVPFARYCSNRGEYVFWDMYHPTQEAARLFADSIFDGSPNYVFPLNLRQLIAV